MRRYARGGGKRGGAALAAFPPVPVTGAAFEHRFRLPPGATWVRAEVYGEDVPDLRGAACNLVGGPDGVPQTTYCGGRIVMLGLTSAIYIRRVNASTG
jgi:hypothetical protein